MAQNPTSIKPSPDQIIGDAASVATAVVQAKQSGTPWYQSKTLWFAALTAALHYTGYLPAQYAVPFTLGGMAVLRAVSNGPLTSGR